MTEEEKHIVIVNQQQGAESFKMMRIYTDLGYLDDAIKMQKVAYLEYWMARYFMRIER